MSIYDERMASNSNQIHFELIPQCFMIVDHCPDLQFIVFQLYKGQQICDQSKKPVQLELTDNNQLKIIKSFINFSVFVNNLDQISQYTLNVLTLVQDTSQIQHVNFNIQDINSQEIAKQSNQNVEFGRNYKQKGQLIKLLQIGSCKINISNYAKQFKQKGTKIFRQTISINKYLKIVFDLYAQKSRFILQKFVRSVKQKQKTYVKRQSDDWIQNSVSSKSNAASSELKKSTQNYDTYKVHKNKFVGVQLVPKKTKDFKNNYLIITQEQSADSRSFNKDQLQTKKNKFQAKQIQDDPLKDIEQDYIQYLQTNQKQQQKPAKKQQKQAKKPQKSKSKQTQTVQFQLTTSKFQRPEKKDKKDKKDKMFKKTYSLGDDFQHQKNKVKDKEQNNYLNITTTKAFIIVFIIFSIFALVKVMTPSKKF